MGAFGFTFEALYRLEVAELQVLARLIRGESYYPPRTKDALIRGVIIPFLREACKAPRNATKDELMCIALVRVAKHLEVPCDKWEAADSAWIMQQIKRQVEVAFRKRFEELDESDREAILSKANEELKKRAAQMGLSLLPASGVVAGELSGFGAYLVTTQALAALSTAIGITLPWVVYQSATTVLGVILGPVGWVLAGAGVVAGGSVFLAQWFKNREEKLKAVVIGIILAVGENPYEWFGMVEIDPMPEVKRTYRAMMRTFHPDVIQKQLPEWVRLHFNELLLQTQENYERIQKHKEEMGE